VATCSMRSELARFRAGHVSSESWNCLAILICMPRERCPRDVVNRPGNSVRSLLSGSALSRVPALRVKPEELTLAAPAQTSLVDLFVARASEATAKVERVPRSAPEIRAAVARATEGAHTLVIADGELLPVAFFSAIRSLPGVIHKPTDDQLATADAGVTEAFAGVARTGSICIAMGGGLRAQASLLMPLHVALLPVERIVFRPRELFEPKGIGEEALKRNLVFVTGPSATADMGPLVRGVHGPHRLYILVVD